MSAYVLQDIFYPEEYNRAGFGATYGVPIGSLVMERYLRGYIPQDRKYLEERMLTSNTIIFTGTKKH